MIFSAGCVLKEQKDISQSETEASSSLDSPVGDTTSKPNVSSEGAVGGASTSAETSVGGANVLVGGVKTSVGGPRSSGDGASASAGAASEKTLSESVLNSARSMANLSTTEKVKSMLDAFRAFGRKGFKPDPEVFFYIQFFYIHLHKADLIAVQLFLQL